MATDDTWCSPPHLGRSQSRYLAAGPPQIYLRDLHHGTTRLLTTNASGAPANGYSRNPAISADGAYVVFESAATDLLPERRAAGDGPGGIYRLHVASGARTRVDVATGDRSPAGAPHSPAISGDGRFVVFVSRDPVPAVRLRDMHERTTTRIERRDNGDVPDGASYHPALSADGRFVAFVAEAARGATKRVGQVYLHDRVERVTELVSRTPADRPGNGPSLRPTLSYDGSTVAFHSLASDLLCAGRKCSPTTTDGNLLWDVFVYERPAQRMIRASGDGTAGWMANSRAPLLDASGELLAFGSRHPTDEHDRRDDEDLFVYRLK